jgi:hypothetical protein
MNKIAYFACQRRKHLKSGELDLALLRMFPKIQVNKRRVLRRPLARWYVAAIKFLQSPRQQADEWQFNDAIRSITDSSPNRGCPYRTFCIVTMFRALSRKIDAALLHFPPDCPSRGSCALLHVIESLFDDTGLSQ